ncbi:coumaroyl-CoA:anthocyanidin 3-O-glucoside-6''-O-coumaroyltransferase 2-like [Primulina huaijiensis]|uniref:coumaroyl-CoA:anthocyanidin 3-O-glucoside-6''-O-coumaroyltransferase 2-like n=1 Tax=Primulina huaijiensis TaxID=1492673 RepID=UPI003CC75E61
MAGSATEIRVVERSAVSPLPRTVAATSLPLTFLDISWLPFPPGQTLFFFNIPNSTSHFMQAILPNLKHSLSLTLHHFFPLSGRLATPRHPAVPRLEYGADDSIFLTIAEAVSGDFKNLGGYHPRMAQDFHKLMPLLQSSTKFGSKHESLLAIQITVFPHHGICIGFTLRHVVADGRTFNNFLKTWAAASSSPLTKNGESLGLNQLLVASHDRSLIKDPNGLEEILLKEWRSIQIPQNASLSKFHPDMTRATFVVGPNEMEKIKKWILTRSEHLFGSTQLLLSPYVITCAFVWVCWMKTHWSNSIEHHPKESTHYFGFIAGGITRLNYSVPSTYSGNCVGFGRSEARRDNLMDENGVLHAAKAIGNTIKRLNSDLLGGAEKWISEWEEMRDSELHVMVTGSPKMDLYGLDFGWGRPIKIEEVSIDETRSISLCESREMSGGVEIGVCLPKPKLELFWTLFNQGLKRD